jgi:hypothetical protein
VGEIAEPQETILILGALGNGEASLQWARDATESRWGNICIASPCFDFDFTSYYEAEMGKGLKKCFFALEAPFDPAGIARIKRQTNEWEVEFADQAGADVARPLNLDPGYVTEAKLVLATTKDRDHRIYLSDGIYAECTLYYHRGQWKDRPWTYPDYQQDSYQAFFSQCRKLLRERLKAKR